MPVAVTCPACAARLTTPDRLIGKRVKCPKCQSPIPVPDPADAGGFEVVNTPPARKSGPASARPAPTRRPVDDEDEDDRPRKRKPARDDEEDEDDRPRKRKPVRDEDDDREPPRAKSRKPVARDDEYEDDDRPRKKPAKKSSLTPILCCVAVVVIVLIGGGLTAVYFIKKSAAGGVGDALAAAVSGVNWVRYDDEATHFTAYFPNQQPAALDPLERVTDPLQRQLAEAFMKDMKTTYLGTTDGNRRYCVGATIMPDIFAREMRRSPTQYLSRMDQALSAEFPGGKLESAGETKVGGFPARNFIVRQGDKTTLVRCVVAGDHVFKLFVEGPSGLAPGDATAAAFFDKFEPKVPDQPAVESPPAGSAQQAPSAGQGSAPKSRMPPGKKK